MGNMPSSSKITIPFKAVESSWSANSAPFWVFRTYISQTVGGVIRSFFNLAEENKMTLGIVNIPQKLHPTLKWSPDDSAKKSGGGLYVFDDYVSQKWKKVRQTYSNRSGLAKEFWGIWVGEMGLAILVAQRSGPQAKLKILPLDVWQLRLSWNPESVLEATEMLNRLWKDYPELKDIGDQILDAIIAYKLNNEKPVLPIFSSTLILADHVDPWTRKHITESAWNNLYNMVQENVAWELHVESLMPSIGKIMQETLGFNLFELLLFSVVDRRHKEFVAWRKNTTGYGDDTTALIIDQKLVTKTIESLKPKLIETTLEGGLMNPHLAEITRLKEGLIVPLVHNGKVNGLMSMYFRHQTGLQQIELDKISRVGGMLARSIENTNVHEHVRRMATIDALTGLFNRRSFNEQIEREMKRFRRYKQNFSLIIIDIDHFKNYNDTNGHLHGDRLLHKFSEVLQDSVRDHDIVSRYGGEEFAVILPHTDIERGMIVAEKIRQRIEMTLFPRAKTQPLGRLTISCGVVDTNSGASSTQELIDQSDKALYVAKENGRNKSIKYSPDLVF
jgi:diguanylate cyclase (GGDEF)-like protein